MRSLLLLRLVFLLACLALNLPRGFAQGGTPVFRHVYVPPPDDAPRSRIPEAKPIPQGVIVTGGAVVAIAGAILLIAAIRAWRESNLFERKYRFPSGGSAALRFGGTRSGGFMASIEPAKEKHNT